MIAETVEQSLASGGTVAAGSLLIRKAAVLGAGNMGSRIAAHLANAGIQVVLLDVVPLDAAPGDKMARSRAALSAIELLTKSKPPAFFGPKLARLVTAGNFEDDLELLRDCDWIIEAVAETLAIKRALWEKVAPFRRKEALVTTNTSGLPVAQIAEGMDEEFRKHWLGTHFFNPPRYLRLLEIIAGPDTERAAIESIKRFGEQRLGKTVVLANDTPNFIGNRVGTFALMNAIRVMQAMDLSIEQVDALTGSVLGWPNTGTFRLSDLVGIDVLASVAKNFFDRVKDERTDLRLPEFIQQMLQKNWLGDKTGQGFYKKTREAGGRETRLGLDWKTLEYRPSERAKFPAVDMAKNAEAIPERLRMLLAGDPRKDQAAAFYWTILPELWNYAAFRIGEICEDIVSIDRAMKAGFRWEMGPFELWDAAGVAPTAEKMKTAGIKLAPAAMKLLANGHQSWYRDEPSGRQFFDVQSGDYKPVPASDGVSSVASVKRSRGVVKHNPGASLIDLGNGVGCIEFHCKMNAIGSDIISLVTQTLKPGGEFVSAFEAFVITNDAENFSAGANLMQLLLAIQEQEWDEIDLVIRSFQKMTQAIKFCPRPVVAAPFGLCLGGGCEVAMHAARRQTHAEVYMGLVETGVGLVPAGGGCKEILLRAVEAAELAGSGARNESVELMDMLRQRYETVALAKVSTSAAEARSMGYLSPSDGLTMNRDRLLADAGESAREMARGYMPPLPRDDIPAPGENILASLRMGVRLMREGEFISEHDAKVANWVAHILCGGKITPGTPISEQYILDLERQAFLSLCGEQKTAERIAYTLKNGKPLRN